MNPRTIPPSSFRRHAIPALTRFHDLDALRGFAMLLGIVLHAAAFLVPIDFWPVQDDWASATPLERNGYAYAASIIHGFRMPLFFLISGFFSALLWQARGLRRLARHRLERIGLPLLAGMFTLVPAVAWLSAAGGFAPVDWLLAWMDGLSHLWFLWHLLLLLAALIVAARLGLEFRHPLWWLLVPLSVVPHHFMQEIVFGADTDIDLLPAPRVFLYYAAFFGFGVFLHQRRVAVRRGWTAALLPALLVTYPAGMALLYVALQNALASPDTQPGGWSWSVASALQVAYAWLACFGMLGLFRWIASRERAWVRYLSDASYWLYLCHLPLVVAGQLLTVGWPVSVHLKFALIITTVVALLLGVYQLGVRYTRIGTTLNGPRVRPVRLHAAGAASG